MRFVKHWISYLQNILEAHLTGHVTDVHIVPVLRRIKLVEVICMQKSVREKCAAEGEPFIAWSVLFLSARILVRKIDLISFIMRDGSNHTCLRSHGLRETI